MKGFLTILVVLAWLVCEAQHPEVSTFIRIDQLGYSCLSEKIAVIIDPQEGYNGHDSYFPGLALGSYEVRRWENHSVIFTGSLVKWNDGNTHGQSGDKGWWFDFSKLTQPGEYYIFDLKTGKRSYQFRIGDDIYAETLKQACRMFFYQRSNFAKKTPFADSRWTDKAAFDGPFQDRYARNRWEKDNPATAKDVSGGWFDAGDYNKYVTLTVEPLSQLLEAYRLHPSVFADNIGIPESGNGIPDILDEVKFEIQWLKKMQDGTGTGGLFLKVGADTWQSASPPSEDNNKRFYLPECTSSTLSGAMIFSLASCIYGKINTSEFNDYTADLKQRAISAWSRAVNTTSNFTIFDTNCDDQNIWAGDADQSAVWQKQCALAAAVYLYESTGQTIYKQFVELNYTTVEPVGTGWWGPYRLFVQKALLHFSELPGVSAVVSSQIRLSKSRTATGMGLPEQAAALDLYKAYMPDAQYTWGSNMTRSACGGIALDYIHYNIDDQNSLRYRDLAEQHLHWLHGTNPMGIVMLSNMYQYGGDSCVNEIFHAWFNHGTEYDNAKNSLKGPPPGYLVGGPNREFSVSKLLPPFNQPVQKSFKDWNTNWNGTFNENSFEITEPAIYYQGMYIALLASLIDLNKLSCNMIVLAPDKFKLTLKKVEKQVKLGWQITQGLKYELFRSNNGKDYIKLRSFVATTSQHFETSDTLINPGQYSFKVTASSDQGAFVTSNIEQTGFADGKQLKIWQARAGNEIFVSSTYKSNPTLVVYSVDGRILSKKSITLSKDEVKRIALNSSSSGILSVKLFDEISQCGTRMMHYN